MRNILQVLTLLGVLFSFSCSDELKALVNVSLKKDEQKKILVKYESYKKLFKFRWTLYTNETLILFKSYGKKESQHVMKLNHQNQSFRINLKPKGAGNFDIPVLLVKFKEFDFEKNLALFELSLSDKNYEISLEYLKNE